MKRAHNFRNLTGERFGRLVAIEAVEKKHRVWNWRCQCDCGNETKHTLDRIDNDGHYEPENVEWGTHKQQSNNRRARIRHRQYDALRNEIARLKNSCAMYAEDHLCFGS